MTRVEAMAIRLRVAARCLMGQRLLLNSSFRVADVARCCGSTWRSIHVPSLCQASAATAAAARAPLDLDPRHEAMQAPPKMPKPKVLYKKDHPLRDYMIPQSAWSVLRTLKNAGYDCYLVGGSVRDLFLQKAPKDFDVLSTASLRQVKRLFPRCYRVGRRFPIVHVHVMGELIEVSSFEETTVAIKRDLSAESDKTGVNGASGGRKGGATEWRAPANSLQDKKDRARLENALKRDFTINGLMYDPFQHVLYDYVGGLRDLNRQTIRTIIPAEESFQEDPARILRAVRVAARMGFPLETSTGKAIERCAPSVLSIPKPRAAMELNIMMAYGSAEPSVRLLWRYRLLEMLLPLHASYFATLNFKRQARRSNFALDLLCTLDQVTSPDRPCDGALWVALSAFHLAAAELLPRTVVMAAVALSCSDRKGLHDAARHARAVYKRIETEARILRENMEGSDSGSKEETVVGNKEESKTEDSNNGGATSRTEQEASCASDGNADQGGNLEPRAETGGNTGAGKANKSTSFKSSSAVEAAGGQRADEVGSMKQIVWEARALGDKSLLALHKMTDTQLTSHTIMALTGLQAKDQVLFTKANIFKAENILRCIGDESLLKKSIRKGQSNNDEGAFDVDDEISEMSFVFSRIILNTIFPRT